jgi:hypothetical protein
LSKFFGCTINEDKQAVTEPKKSTNDDGQILVVKLNYDKQLPVWPHLDLTAF